MFEWNVEELKLLNHKNREIVSGKKIYNCEYDVSREDKIKFVDKMQDGKLSYILNLAQKLEKDKEHMPIDVHGNIKANSLKEWVEKNDSKNLIDITHKQGNLQFLTCRDIQNLNKIDVCDACGDYIEFDTYDDYVDEVFNRQLKECERLEYNYVVVREGQ